MAKATRDAYGEILKELGAENPKIVVLDADLSSSTKTAEFKKVFPERHFNCGIAEQNMMGVAAGLRQQAKFLLLRRLLYLAPVVPTNKSEILFAILSSTLKLR